MNQYKQREDSSSPIPGAAYIRFSSEMQSDSFSLDAQLRQIKEQAERDNVAIVKVYSDPAQSAYRKRYRPGINAMREAARLSLAPLSGLTCRCCKFHFMLRAAVLLPFLRELQRFDIASHLTTSVACYLAA